MQTVPRLHFLSRPIFRRRRRWRKKFCIWIILKFKLLHTVFFTVCQKSVRGWRMFSSLLLVLKRLSYFDSYGKYKILNWEMSGVVEDGEDEAAAAMVEFDRLDSPPASNQRTKAKDLKPAWTWLLAHWTSCKHIVSQPADFLSCYRESCSCRGCDLSERRRQRCHTGRRTKLLICKKKEDMCERTD